MNADELRTATEHLRETVTLKNGKWDESMLGDVLRECAELSEEEFFYALQRCKAELRFPIVPADVTDRCPSLAVQSADEAWLAIGSKSEADTVIWSDLTAAAWGEVAQEQDSTAQRMAFRKVYERLAAGWKTAGRRPKVQVSLGTDQARRTETIRRAVNEKRLPVTEGRRLLGLPPSGSNSQKLLAEPHNPIQEGIELTESDRLFFGRLLDPKQNYHPTELEVTSKLGPYASEKFRLFLAGTRKKLGDSWDESLCKDCSAKLAEPTKTTRCPRCAAIKREETKR